MGYPASPHEAQAMGLYPFFIPLDKSEGTEAMADGRRLIMIGSNNYVGLTAHPKVKQAAIEALQRFGPSCTGSRFLNGTLALHEELESRLARFVGMEDALVFSTGYQTNLGTLSALVGRGDVIIGDKENHASLVDGSRLALGKLLRFRHNDMNDLERVLSRAPENAGKLVVVDGVFSMSGEIAPLPEIVSLCQKYGARLMVDDAHGMGVTGRGHGTAAQYGLTDQVDLIMGTFSKSFASIGGFIAGAASTIHWIKHLARPLIFSASLPAPNAAAALASLDVIEQEPERVDRVNSIGERMRRGYRELGLNIGSSETPIIPILIGDQLKTMKAWRALFDAGVYTNVAV
ncbi:MAG TPA: aminotransferase class I/II-fold pyridoxal phosphate-dependent enzyme, partial [Candidatus Acetothermia bacterium]|nr:aminotransferase class I/II-fold pyridoxal phosphate-dependent enzyme [Candidatus Acetothermia bacterium]HEX32396.1 aminotransferase class I/II-fold pyridoxal phosphate-dependent enzyme [Candidatus Acetothermia bacterium]